VPTLPALERKTGALPSPRRTTAGTRQNAPPSGAWRLVYQHLRDAIVRLELAPGAPISEKDLAQRFGVSRTPVREAIQRLADERLIEIFPQAGTFVGRIPYDELPEAMVIRKALERTTVAAAAERASRSQTLSLASLIEQQREAAAIDDHAAFHQGDELFHAKIAEIAGYPGIWRLVLQVKTQVDRFRRTTLSLPHRMAAVVAEHEAVLAGIDRGDPTLAAEAMAKHLDAVLPKEAVNGIAPG
jgi:GntR family transcriptional regulator, rspAB operon transcriptional repressor